MHATRTPPSSLSGEQTQLSQESNRFSQESSEATPSDECSLPQALRSLEHLTPSLRARLESRGRLRSSLDGVRKDRSDSGGGISTRDASTVTGMIIYYLFIYKKAVNKFRFLPLKKSIKVEINS